MIQLLNSVPQEILTLESTPVDIQRQKWQLLSGAVMTAENDEICDAIYSNSPELLRMVLSGTKITFAFPPEELAEETHQKVLDIDALQTNLITPFTDKTGKLYVTSRRLLYVPEGDNNMAVQFDYRSLLMHAVPKVTEGTPCLLCQFDTTDLKDVNGKNIPLFDKETLAELEDDPDYMPYFEVMFSCERTAGSIDDLYNAVMDATMLAGYSPSMLNDMFGGMTGGCCGAKGADCCVGQACCDSDDSDCGDCCQDDDRGCCASENE